MAFGTYQNYQPMYYQPQQQQNNNGVIWVQGEAGAKSYLVAPNSTVQLWDSEAPIIYLKSADASGMPTIKYIDYKIRTDNQPTQNPVKVEEPVYATKEDIDYLKDEIDALRKEIKANKRSYNRRREVTEDE